MRKIVQYRGVPNISKGVIEFKNSDIAIFYEVHLEKMNPNFEKASAILKHFLELLNNFFLCNDSGQTVVVK